MVTLGTKVSGVELHRTPGELLKKVCSFPAMLTVLLAGLIFLAVPRSVTDPDISWHLRNAQVLVQTHRWIHADLYSWTTRGQRWVNPEWLGELPYLAGWKVGGWRGVFAVELIGIEASLLGIFWLAYLQSRSIKAAFVAGFLAIFAADVSFGPRTLLFGWMLLVLELTILYRWEQSSGATGEHDKSLWLLPPLFAVWINTHGSWLIGLVLLGVFCACGWIAGSWGTIEARRWNVSERRNVLRVWFASVAALFVNPYGWRLVVYPFDLAFRQKLNIENVQEWRSLDFHTPRGKIVLAIAVGALLLQFVRQRRWKLFEVAFLLIAIYSALTYSRFLFLGAILVLPLLVRDWGGWMPYHPEQDKPWLNLPIMVGMIVAVGMLFPTQARLDSSWDREYPRQALQHLASLHLQGNLLNQYEWGGNLIWNTPEIPVFVDSRVDVFEHHGVLKDYLNAIRLDDTFRIFDQYSIRYVLFQKSAPLSYMLMHTPGWKIKYQDNTAVLFERIATPGGKS